MSDSKRRAPTPRAPRSGQIAVSMVELAWMLDKTYDWVVRNIDTMISLHGFPAPRDLPGQRRWSRRQVQAWLDGERPESRAPARAAEIDYDAILDRRNQNIADRAQRKPAA